ncbi:MAG: hypothetical protein GC155_06235 [Alphaproteobacteria bacterium]|nr:hypothetical protein [Alphaproteobacteria bacterium]
MRIDSRLVMSDEQAITGTAASTSHIDLGADRNIGAGEPLWWVVFCSEDFTLLTSLSMSLESDDNSSFSSPVAKLTESKTLAQLAAGVRVVAQRLPDGLERYIRSKYTVTGTDPDAGKLTSCIAKAPELRKLYAKNYSV